MMIQVQEKVDTASVQTSARKAARLVDEIHNMYDGYNAAMLDRTTLPMDLSELSTSHKYMMTVMILSPSR